MNPRAPFGVAADASTFEAVQGACRRKFGTAYNGGLCLLIPWGFDEVLGLEDFSIQPGGPCRMHISAVRNKLYRWKGPVKTDDTVFATPLSALALNDAKAPLRFFS